MALLQSLKVVGGYGTSAHPSEVQLEANSSTFEKGAVLRYNGSGRLAEAGVDPVDIVGVALEDGENGTDKKCRLCPAMPGVIFSGQIDDGTLNGTYALAAGDLGTAYGLTKDAGTGSWYVDQSKTGAQARVIVVGFGGAAAADLNARVLFIFKQGQTAYA